MTRVLAWTLGVVALASSGGYVFVYIYRWEWNRALIMLGFFVAAEVALATALVLRQLARRPVAPAAGPDVEVLERIRGGRPERAHFAWLETSSSQFNVFITLLVGGGAVISGAAWLLDRIASRTGPTPSEHALADRLASIAFPADGLVADEAELLAQEVPFRDDPDLRLLLGPHRERAVSRVVAWVGVLVAVLVGIIALRQETMSVHQVAPPGSSTRVVVAASTRNQPATTSAESMTRAQVALCRLEVHDETTDPGFVAVDGATFEFALRPALDESDRRQLHGCLEDARIDHLQLRVVRMHDDGGPARPG